METFTDVYNNCSFSSKMKLIIIKLIEYSVFVFLLAGLFMPKNMTLIYSLICLMLLINIDAEIVVLRRYTYETIKSNVKKPRIELNNLSNTVNCSHNSCKTILLVLLIISLIGYMCPDYSVYNLVCKLWKKFEKINERDIINDDYKIATTVVKKDMSIMSNDFDLKK